MIRTQIAADRGIEDTDIKVEADGGIITVAGKADTVGEANRIMRVVRETPGVRELRFNMAIRTSGVYSST